MAGRARFGLILAAAQAVAGSRTRLMRPSMLETMIWFAVLSGQVPREPPSHDQAFIEIIALSPDGQQLCFSSNRGR